MNYSYYGVDVLVELVPRGKLPAGDGACWMDWGDNVCLIRVSDDLNEDQSLKTLNHELGHVWQGIKQNNLRTQIPWPAIHYGASRPCEDFPEAFRIALLGLCIERDEQILFEWVNGFSGLYQRKVTQEVEDAFVSLCRAEVFRLLGFIPEVQNF